MTKEVDYRVVEMRFNNKEFESGAKQTMNTLTRLKEALKLPEAAKSLENIDKATKNISLDGIAAGVDLLSRRFSTMGIVGMRVIENITDALMNKLSLAINKVTDSIVSGGIKRAMNIENAHFQLQALLKDESKVQAVMDNAMESVDGTAYAYDEAAKAAAQFAASGVKAGDEMLGSLKAITGVAAMTNSDFESISRIFTTVAGNGRLMGDQLLQLSSRGLNAASTLATYFQEVRGQSEMTEARIREMVSDGALDFKTFADAMTWAFGDSAKRANETFTGSISNMKSALARIGAGFVSPLVEQNSELVKMFNALRIKINDVKAALVFDEQKSAISGLSEVTHIHSGILTDMFETIKKNGHVSSKELQNLELNGAHASIALVKYMNGVTDGSIRASYAIQKAVTDLTNGTEVDILDVRRFVEEGKIDLATFTSAMETEFGNQKKLSKRFTDFVLNTVKAITTVINNTDMTKPMAIFNHGVESLINLLKGLWSIIKPVGIAFGEAFFSFDIDSVLHLSEYIEKVTSKMKLSEKGSKNLHDAMKGIFDVGKLLIDICIKLVSVIIPINKPIVEMGGGLLGLLGTIGRLLSAFTEWIRKSPTINKSYALIAGGINYVMISLSKLIKGTVNFIEKISRIPVVQKVLDGLLSKLSKIGSIGSKSLDSLIILLKQFKNNVLNLIPEKIERRLSSFIDYLSTISIDFNSIDLSDVTKMFDTLGTAIKNLIGIVVSNEGLESFLNEMKNFGDRLKESLSFDNLVDKINQIKLVIGDFVEWIKSTLAPVFKNFNLGGAIATGSGIAIIYAVIKAFKSLNSISESLKSIPNLLNSVKSAISTYEKDLNASAILKISAAIAILAGTLILLSFADTDKLMQSALALSIIAGVLLYGMTQFVNALKKGEKVEKVANIFAKGVSDSLRNLTKSFQTRALGKAVLRFAESIVLITGSIIALGIMYRKDKEALMNAFKLVGILVLVLGGIMASMTILGNFMGTGMINFSKAALGVLAISLSLTLIVSALNKLFKMKFPEDWKTKIGLLAVILAGLSSLTLIVGVASRIAGGGSLKAGPILALAITLMVTVSALNKLFKMELPNDWGEKITILGILFAELSVLMISLGIASRIAGGSIKAAGSILAMCVMIGTIVGALMILAIIPTAKLLGGTVALGTILISLGTSLIMASKITSKETYKSILAMAIAVGTITAALGVLSMVPFASLLKSTLALGSILLVLAETFRSVSKITNEKAWISIIAMIGAVITIATSLSILAEQPWSGLLAAAVAMSSVMLTMSGVFKIISSSQSINLEGIALFLFATTSIIPIAVALYELSSKPWENMLASAASISAVILSLGVTMGICSTVGMTAQAALVGIGLLDLFIANFALVLIALNALLNSEGAKAMISGGAEILAMIGEAIGMFVGAIVGGVLEGVSMALPGIAANLSDFATNLEPFMNKVSKFDDNALAGCTKLAAAIVLITAAEVVAGIGAIAGGGIGYAIMAEQMNLFIEKLEPFIDAVSNISSDTLNGVKIIAEMIITLTAADIINGLGHFFGLTGSLSDFGKELVALGPSLAIFARTVKGITKSSVEGAAAAAEMLAQVATKLPAQNGWVQKVFGSKSLKDFGMELVSFGPSIRLFANTVKDVKKSSVEGAAAAGEIMATLATKLPAQNGWVQKVFGSKSLAEFGKELTLFGYAIVPFTNTVKNINPSSVSGVESVTTIMTNLANNLPSSESLWNKIFGGGNVTLSEFATELQNFGTGMEAFSSKTENVKTALIDNAVTSFYNLVNLAKYITDNKTTGLSDFTKELGKVSLTAVEDFANGFKDSSSKVTKAISTLFNAASKAMKSKSGDLKATGRSIGVDIGSSIKMGLAGQQIILAAAVASLAASLVKSLKTALQTSTFTTIGQNIIQALATGISNKKANVLAAVQNVSRDLINKMKSQLPSSTFRTTGNGLVQGLINGLNDKKQELYNLVTEICNAVVNYINLKLDTKIFRDVGSGISAGVAEGINNKVKEAMDATAFLCATVNTTLGNGMPYSSYREIGASAGRGVKDGINESTPGVADAATSMGQAAVQGAKNGAPYNAFREIGISCGRGVKDGLEVTKSSVAAKAQEIANIVAEAMRMAAQIHSPSRVTRQIGVYMGEGLVLGLNSMSNSVKKSGMQISNNAIGTLKQMVDTITNLMNDKDFDIHPKVVPVMDLSNIEDGTESISNMLSDSIKVKEAIDLSETYSKLMNAATSFNTLNNSKNKNEKPETLRKEEKEQTFNFVQNNYSPKELSRSEIYRQTNSQFSEFERRVKKI